MKYKNRFDLSGKVVLITGGAGLLGAQYTYGLLECGARVVVADINGVRAEQVAGRRKGVECLPIQVDVSNPASVKKMVQSTLEMFGKIDSLVNNAAIDPKFDQENQPTCSGEFETYPLNLWNHSIAVDLTGMFLCTQAVAPTMLKQGSGTVINISSMYGMVGPDQRLYKSEKSTSEARYKPVVYSVTKCATYGFTRYLSAYWAGKGIRVNSLTLGGVFNKHDDEFVERYNWRTPLGRMAQKDEYCGALIFLLSEASSYMTGSNLVVDGGWTSW